MSDRSSLDFFDKAVTRPCFSADGKSSLLNDMFASLVTSGAMTSTVDSSDGGLVVGMKSTTWQTWMERRT